jgi:phage portal protein BeeE
MAQMAGPSAQLLNDAIMLQDGLIAWATGKSFEESVYRKLRREFLGNAELKPKLPKFVQLYRDFPQFWNFIARQSETYKERRAFIWDQFRPLIDHLESLDHYPGVAPISDALESFDPEHIHAIWQKALTRRTSDPEGAITAARTLLESVCKHILDDAGVPYLDDADLPKLWGQAAELLNLAPAQHQETVFKAILGNCQSVVNHLAAIRNRAGDAHGQGRRQVRPKARHAELAVNLAGTMASFLVTTWKERAISQRKTA